MKINQLLTPYNFTRRGDTGRIKYLVIHYVGATGGAQANCRYYASQYVGASAHYYVGFDGQIWQSVKDEDIAWSVGASRYVHPDCRNSNSLNIELCVKKKSTATMNATDKDWYHTQATYNSAVELAAYLMKKYNIPMDHLLMHYHVTGKYCDAVFLNGNTGMTWDGFKADVAKALGSNYTPTSGKSTTIKYKVGLSLENGVVTGQIGAYSSYANAKAAAKNAGANYSVFNMEKNAKVYPKSSGKKTNTTLSFDTITAKDLQGNQEQRIKMVAPIYQKCQIDTGMLASVGLAQFCLESGYGTTDLARNANNMHGMKANLSGNNWANSSWDGKSVYAKNTQEQNTNGSVYTIKDNFRKYSSIKQSVYDRAAYLIGAMNGSQRRYPGVNLITDPQKQIELIKAGGYATDINYVNKIMTLIRQYNLTQYDVTNRVDYSKFGVVKPSTPSTKPSGGNTIYRVGKTINSDGSVNGQIGAYQNLDNAKDASDKAGDGYNVFDANSKKRVYPKKYIVQVGAYSSRKNAVARQKQLEKAGFKSRIRMSGKAYCVIAGTFAKEENVKSFCEKLTKKGIEYMVKS